MKKLGIKLRKPSGSGVFHDSRSDSRALMKAVNKVISKVNQLVSGYNMLQSNPRKRLQKLNHKNDKTQ